MSSALVSEVLRYVFFKCVISHGIREEVEPEAKVNAEHGLTPA